MKEAYGQDFPFDELDRHVYAMRDKKYANGLPLKSGIRELLTALKEAGIPKKSATNAVLLFEAFGFDRFFGRTEVMELLSLTPSPASSSRISRRQWPRALPRWPRPASRR